MLCHREKRESKLVQSGSDIADNWAMFGEQVSREVCATNFGIAHV